MRLQKQLGKWSLDRVSAPQCGLSFYLSHFPAQALYFSSNILPLFTFLWGTTHKSHIFTASLNNPVVDRKFSKSYCRRKRVLQTSFRSGSFFIPKKLSPHCVWKEPTEHFFSKSSKSAKISHLFLISILWIMVLNAFCLRLNHMIDRWKRASKWRWELSSINHIVCTLSISPWRQGLPHWYVHSGRLSRNKDRKSQKSYWNEEPRCLHSRNPNCNVQL